MRLTPHHFRPSSRDAATNTLTPPIAPGAGLPDWVFTEKLVAKPDQLIKRRGKAGLLCLNKGWEDVKEWITARAGKPVQVEKTTGTLNTFIIEPFLPHPSNTEYYVCINSTRDGDEILFTHEGGVDVGDVDAKALKLRASFLAPRLWRPVSQSMTCTGRPTDLNFRLPTCAVVEVTGEFPSRETIIGSLLTHVPAEKKDVLCDFLIRLYAVYEDLHCASRSLPPSSPPRRRTGLLC